MRMPKMYRAPLQALQSTHATVSSENGLTPCSHCSSAQLVSVPTQGVLEYPGSAGVPLKLNFSAKTPNISLACMLT